MPQNPKIECVGVVCFRGNDVLLIQRAKAPRKGDWSIPGGRIEIGETQKDAALRELFEETHILAKLGPKIATIPASFEGVDYILHDYLAEWEGNEPQPGDDAARARFIPPEKISHLGMWPKTVEIIEMARKARLSEFKKTEQKK